jgi:hypothetical protein
MLENVFSCWHTSAAATGAGRASPSSCGIRVHFCARFGGSRPIRTHGSEQLRVSTSDWRCDAPLNVSVRPTNHSRGPTREKLTGHWRSPLLLREQQELLGAVSEHCGQHRVHHRSPPLASSRIRALALQPAARCYVVDERAPALDSWRRPSSLGETHFHHLTHPSYPALPLHRCCCWTAILNERLCLIRSLCLIISFLRSSPATSAWLFIAPAPACLSIDALHCDQRALQDTPLGTRRLPRPRPPLLDTLRGPSRTSGPPHIRAPAANFDPPDTLERALFAATL